MRYAAPCATRLARRVRGAAGSTVSLAVRNLLRDSREMRTVAPNFDAFNRPSRMSLSSVEALMRNSRAASSLVSSVAVSIAPPPLHVDERRVCATSGSLRGECRSADGYAAILFLIASLDRPVEDAAAFIQPRSCPLSNTHLSRNF